MESNLRIKILELQREIAEDLRRVNSRSGHQRLPAVFDVILKFDSLASCLYEVRAKFPSSHELVARTEDIVGTLSRELIQLQQNEKDGENAYDHFFRRYRSLWRQNISLFLLTLFVFIGSCFIGYEVATQSPEFVSVILPQSMIEDVLQKKEWFQELNKSPFLDGIRIAVNNIGVGIKCFLGGALLGVGGAVLLIFNGVLFGAILGFCTSHGFREALMQFVAGHGPLELSIIVAAAFSGFIFGAAFYKRPVSLFRFRMAKAAGEAGCLLMGILPWLLLAAAMESFVSPLDFIPGEMKLFAGLVCALMFWMWTFLPESTRKKTGADDGKVYR